MANKKAQRRPNKARSRSNNRRPVSAGTQTLEVEEVPVAPVASTMGATPARQSAPARQPAARAQSPRAARRAPLMAINYHYLRHDLLTLAVLAPAMVVLVLIAFVFLH